MPDASPGGFDTLSTNGGAQPGERSVPERVAMNVTGHKTRAVSDGYHIVSLGDLKNVARRLSGEARVG